LAIKQAFKGAERDGMIKAWDEIAYIYSLENAQ